MPLLFFEIRISVLNVQEALLTGCARHCVDVIKE